MENNELSSNTRKLECSDVSKCFQLLESILDGDMGEEGKDVLKEKLAKCQPCFEHYHLEQAIREVLKNKCTKQPCPEKLADSIRQMIQEIK
ncbi:MAG: mycothiol system anti-sigma-R factor [Cyclobacteriaceae bacterium]|uniref:mycothiol system anti-sigma-R factor n=1 Tax=Algoriphagus mannitolivorans TaxID=226504 RepID=UPI0004265683|nr:mycothiol system anti-sigma-R factor [Algoriphagus mannitolivorans]MDX5338125.1 mycothiol system anti-sigma-R factor [Cyclobacteriaceae bacterium]